MKARVYKLRRILLASIGMALLGLMVLHAHAQVVSTVLTGTCQPDFTFDCPACDIIIADARPTHFAAMANAQPADVGYTGCSGGLNVPPYYQQGICDQANNTRCTQAIIGCGIKIDCSDGAILGNCNAATGCYNGVFV